MFGMADERVCLEVYGLERELELSEECQGSCFLVLPARVRAK
jgi:hypothetical protein